jgi:hypothetical protein
MVYKEFKVFKGQLVLEVKKVIQVLLVKQEPKVELVIRALWVILVVQQVKLVLLAIRAQ